MASYGKPSVLEGIKDQVAAAKHGDKTARKNFIAVAVCLLSLVAVTVVMILTFRGGDSAASVSEQRTVIDAETGELFENFRIPEGKAFPYDNPKTGKAKLFPAEACFWTKDGKIKDKPTWVLLNEHAGKPGQTVCPDCGHPVKQHNPYPVIK